MKKHGVALNLEGDSIRLNLFFNASIKREEMNVYVKKLQRFIQSSYSHF